MSDNTAAPQVTVIPSTSPQAAAAPSRGARLSRRLTGALAAICDGVVLAGLALWEALAILWLAASITMIIVGLGLLLVPSALALTRADARLQRRLAARYSGIDVSETYRNLPRLPGFTGAWRTVYAMAGDDATWRDLLWHLVNPIVGLAIALTPLLGVLHGVWGVVLLTLWRPVIAVWENSWYAFIPLQNEGSAVLAALLGVIEIVLFLALAAPLIRLHGRWVRAVLGRPSAAALAARVEVLTDSRSDAIDHQDAEIRRIERDLHDGAQARLVAMGMNLTAASRLLDTDPGAARVLLDEAKSSSASALKEIRDLVRGIHPPVLSDRGLVDAVRALALDAPIPAELTVGAGLEGRLLPPVESAIYFAISELLTNAAKHASATRVAITIDHRDGVLAATVLDDGVGGVQEREGSGLAGIRRRIAAFDGTLIVSSPDGGPTAITIRIPSTLRGESVRTSA